MSPLLLGLLTFATGAISGTVGMAGGMILLAGLGATLPTGDALVLHAGTQLASNVGRTTLQLRHVRWRPLGAYVVGTLGVLVVVRDLVVVPSPLVLALLLGVLPLVSRRLPRLPPGPYSAFAAGVICTGVQTVCGTSGPLLDVVWNDPRLGRHEVLGTKSAATAVAHLARLFVFAPLVAPPDPRLLGIAITGTLAGTALGAVLLEHLDDQTFRRATNVLIDVLAVGWLVHALA